MRNPTLDSTVAKPTSLAERLQARGISGRVILLAFVIAPFNAYFMAYLQGPRGIEDPTVVALFWNVVFLLTIFRLINALLLRYFPRVAFSPMETVAFFILLSVATAPTGQDSMNTTFSTMQGVARFSTEVNHWDQLFGEKLPLSMTVNDQRVLDRLWEGDSSIFEPRNYMAWIGPVGLWVLLFTVMWSAPAGLAVILRKRWVESERMSFPIVQLPYEMAQTNTHAFRTSAFWVAAGIVAVINLLNGLHVFFPAVPEIAVKIGQSETFNLTKFFVGRPWNAVGRFHVCLYPFVVGLGLLLPTELSLSLWVFYLFWKVEAIAAAWMGVTLPEFPYMKEQSFGGYLAILGFSLWAGRRYFGEVWTRLITGVRGEDDSAEALSYRNSALLFVAGMAAAVGIGIFIKMSPLVAILFFVQYYAMTAIVGRIRAEMGLPTHELERLGPTVMQGNILGPRLLGVQNLTSLSLFFGFTRGIRNIPFPHQFEALYLAQKEGGSQRRLLLATMAMVPFAVALAFFFKLMLGYQLGVGYYRSGWMLWSSQEAWNQLANWLNQNQGIQWGRAIASVLGFFVYFGLMVVRTTWVSWPLHPAGFALSTTWYMAHMWFPMLVAWLMKAVSLRYVGAKAQKTLRHIAFGLILSDIVTGCLWILYGLFTNTRTYSFWP